MNISVKNLTISVLLALTMILFARFLLADQRTKKIDHYMQAQTDLRNFSGAVLVAKDGKVIISKAYGLANYELDVANIPKTKFRIASVTKQFTAMAILQLQERGLLSVNDPLSKYIPDFPRGNEITIHHLLTHTSGITNFTDFPDYEEFKIKPSTLEKIIDAVKTKSLDFNPGEQWKYSNSGYVILTYIIEKVSGKTYEKFIEENIFEPLEMHDSGYDHHNTIIKNRASGYSMDKHGIKNADYIDMSWPAGAGGLYSTVEDLYKWDRALYTEKLISKKSLETMMHAHISTSPDDTENCYGYGFGVSKMEGATCIAHEGGIDGFESYILRFPENNMVIIILCNKNLHATGTISKAIHAIMFDKPYQMPKKHVAIKLDSHILDAYVGTYKFIIGGKEKEVIITLEDDHLLSGLKDQPPLKLYPESETEFFHADLDLPATFIKDKDGKVTGLILHYEKDIKGEKIL